VLAADWRFLGSDASGAEAPSFDDAGWEAVNVPHTWNALDGQDGGDDYHRGVGWYRRRFVVPSERAERRFYLQFDAANAVATVFVNGKALGEHRGGYSSFRVDATDALITGENVLAVRVDNAEAPDVAPLSADYTFFGGLYRDVHLLAVNELHVDLDDLGSSGRYLDVVPSADGSRATLGARARVTNAAASARTADATLSVLDASGDEVARWSASEPLAAGETRALTLGGDLASPHLWDGLRDPYLYTARLEVSHDGATPDRVDQSFGVRTFALDPGAGFSLNGQYLDLHGVNRHQDRKDLGWAIGPAQHDEDMALIREIGATAVRLAHYQQAREFYDRCDREGLIVWAEIPLVDEITPGAAFADNANLQMRELIRQNYNHPSIVFWGIGNEQRTDNVDTNLALAGVAQVVAAEDPARISAYAHCCASERAGVAGHSQALGFNAYYGWYMGAYTDVGAWADRLHTILPDRPLALSEYGAGASLTQHEDPPRMPVTTGPFHPEEYQTALHEATWQQLASRPFIWGKFVWNMFDFASDSRSEGDALGINDKGLVSYDRRIKKDAFYWYKASWSNEPVLYITSRRFTPRTTPLVDVKVYSNATSVSLSLAGAALPAPETPAEHIFLFRGVPLQPGDNTLLATSVDAARGPATDSVTWVLE
jgi:beta-galactosidase